MPFGRKRESLGRRRAAKRATALINPEEIVLNIIIMFITIIKVWFEN